VELKLRKKMFKTVKVTITIRCGGKKLSETITQYWLPDASLKDIMEEIKKLLGD